MAQQAAATEQKSGDKPSQKLIVITGASSGIGEACVIPFVEAGYPVLMLARNVANMEKGKAAVVEKLGKDCEALIFIKKCDVTAAAAKDGTHSIDSAIKECLEENKDKNMYCDCIINNAGVMLIEPLTTQPMDKIQLMLDVNVNGVILGMKAVVGDMVKRKQGTIINISSMAGKKLMKSAIAYCATKFAVQALTEGLRQEVCKSNVRVCVLCPGAVATNLLSTNSDEVKAYMGGWLKSLELGVCLPVDIANGCYYMYNQPPRCCIREMHITPTNQEQP